MKLKACLNPNCEEPDVRIEKGNSMVKVWCAYCEASTGWMDTEAEAISAWNQRHSAVKVATVDLKPLHDLAEKWKYLWYDLSGDSGGYGECAKELRKALKQMEA